MGEDRLEWLACRSLLLLYYQGVFISLWSSTLFCEIGFLDSILSLQTECGNAAYLLDMTKDDAISTRRR